MKNKLGIKSRVFLIFSFFIIIIVNIFAYLLYFFVSENIKQNTYKSISNEFETIKTFIDVQSSNIFSLPKYEIEKINNLGFYFYIGNNDYKLKKQYKIGFYTNQKDIIFRGDYKGYNIIIGKNNNDFIHFKNSFFDILLVLNLLLIIMTLGLSYILTNISLKPFLNLSNFLNNYDFNSNSDLLKNKYGETELGVLTKSINNFIKKNNTILENQTNFIQDVNHELKTPLMQIESNLELIENKIEDKKIQNRLKNISESVNIINDIISDLGFILRGEKNIKNKEKIILYNYLINHIKKYDLLLQEKNIKIIIDKKYDLVISNNTYYLDRIFGNIISNAIFYNKGNNTITITISKNSISIKDEGIGIQQDEINKIFSRFYRNKNSGLYYKNGNGLGLVIVQKICDIFGWKIEVNSEINKGSEFKIFTH